MWIFSKRALHFIWLLALAVLVSACSETEDSQAGPANNNPGNVLRIDVDCDFGSFYPDTGACSGSTYVFPFIYSLLCVPSPDGGLEPDLASGWDYEAKTCTWRIRLRSDARFHNGDPVTATDAAYSILTSTEKLLEGLAQQIKSVQAVDEFALEIELKQDDPFFLNSIWDVEIIPAPTHHSNPYLNHAPVGSGPFQFNRRTDDGRVELSANENYYRGRPSIDKVVLSYIPDRNKSWARLLTGDTDIVGDLGVKNYQIMEQYADRFYFSKTPYHYYKILLYNTHHPLFQNPLVRRALTHAIDREYIVQKMLGGMAETVAGPMGNRSPFHDPDLKPLAYDPTLALELLAKEGWTTDPRTQYLMKNGQFFEFELLLPSGDETDIRVARSIMLCLNDVGIRAHLKTLPPDVFHRHFLQNTDFDAVLTDLTANPRRPEEVLGLWVKMDDTPSKSDRFDSPEAARLAALILAANNPDAKKAIFREFDRLIADLQPGSFLFQKTYIDAMSKRFTLNNPFYIDYSLGYRMQSARLKNE